MVAESRKNGNASWNNSGAAKNGKKDRKFNMINFKNTVLLLGHEKRR